MRKKYKTRKEYNLKQGLPFTERLGLSEYIKERKLEQKVNNNGDAKKGCLYLVCIAVFTVVILVMVATCSISPDTTSSGKGVNWDTPYCQSLRAEYNRRLNNGEGWRQKDIAEASIRNDC